MSSSEPQQCYPIGDPSQEGEFFTPGIMTPQSSPFYGPLHFPETPQTPSPYLTSYGSPISPSVALSRPLHQMHLSDSDFDMGNYQHTLAFLPVGLTHSESELMPGTVSGSHASHFDRASRPSINIQTAELCLSYPTPHLSAASTASSSRSSYLPSPRTPSDPNPGTCPTFTKPLPDDCTIDPTLLQPTPEMNRGRSLGLGPLDNRRSRSAVGHGSSHGRSQRSARPGRSSRSSRHKREDSPLPLGLISFGVGPAEEQPMSMSILFDTCFSEEPSWDHGDRSQSADEDVKAMPASICQDQMVNGKLPCPSGDAEGKPGFKPVVASEEVVQASKIRRTTKGPRHKCPIEGCKADFTAKHNLKNHLNAHNGVKNYACPHCERRYTTSHVMNRHRKTCRQAKGKRKAAQ